ncbi:hypothetical protein [Telluribacter sp.]|jgi:hypothetical protein|uniref:hypothetical protein n=1 Tax=Telluribacter sp. TaxID=1978767 RepID=UPI002E1654DD|nr:hypothetical protein [Telluribacter sp.]
MKVILLFIPLFLWLIGWSYFPVEFIRKERAFETYFGDSVLIEVDLAYTQAGKPEYYTSHVRTPVCKDSLCYLVVIDLSWDLLGNFKEYKLPPKAPLTKFDHDPFTEEDHKKLKTILSNKTSLLRDYDMKALVDEKEKRTSSVVDATSGATSATIRDEVVGGALYTTHTLWHIVNGEVAEKILKHTEARFTNSMLLDMLQADNFQYQFYALKKIPSESTPKYLPHLIRLMASGDSYVPFFAIEKLPDVVWTTPTYQKELAGMVGRVKFEMQNELLNKLKGYPLHSGTLDELTRNLKSMTEQQTTKVLGLLKTNQAALNQESLVRLEPFLESPVKEIASLTYQLFQSQAEKHKEVKKILSKREKL